MICTDETGYMVARHSAARYRWFLLLAALLFSTGGAAIKASALTSWQVAGFRSGVGALVLYPALPGARRGWTWRTLLIGAAYAATLILFVLANKTTTSANAIFCNRLLRCTYCARTAAVARAGARCRFRGNRGCCGGSGVTGVRWTEFGGYGSRPRTRKPDGACGWIYMGAFDRRFAVDGEAVEQHRSIGRDGNCRKSDRISGLPSDGMASDARERSGCGRNCSIWVFSRWQWHTCC